MSFGNGNSQNMMDDGGSSKFPTVGLKSLLQNSDLLELLLKPLSKSDNNPNLITTTNSEYSPQLETNLSPSAGSCSNENTADFLTDAQLEVLNDLNGIIDDSKLKSPSNDFEYSDAYLESTLTKLTNISD